MRRDNNDTSTNEDGKIGQDGKYDWQKPSLVETVVAETGQPATQDTAKGKKSPEYISAKATRNIAFFTFVIMLCNGVYAILAWWTLSVQGSQLGIMDRQLLAANTGNDSQRRQLRPYVDANPYWKEPTNWDGIRQVTYDKNYSEGLDPRKSNGTIVFEVSGSTPALSIVVKSSFNIVRLVKPSFNPSNVFPPIIIGDPPYYDPLGRVKVGRIENSTASVINEDASIARLMETISSPYAKPTINVISLSQPWISIVPKFNVDPSVFKDRYPVFSGVVTYKDGFNIEYSTPFCSILLSEGEGVYYNKKAECTTGEDPT